MLFIKKITDSINDLSTKNFYLYGGIFLAIIFAIHGFIIFNYYRSVSNLEEQIEEINELREQKLQKLLKSAHQVRKQREEFNDLLAQDPDFKLGNYVENLLTGLHLTKESDKIDQIEREEGYLETIMNLKLTNINTQQAAQLLDKIEREPRITVKAVEIIKSKKKPNTIEVLLTIAALQQK